MKKIIIVIVVVAVIVWFGYTKLSKKSEAPVVSPSVEATESPQAVEGLSPSPSSNAEKTMEDGTITVGAVKEFSLDSFMKMDGTARVAGFSVKEIRVKKGDMVKITVNNTAGTHDFAIDEFGVKKDTPEGQKTVIEFTADKVGDFKYYCSKYNHRQLGQEGVLHITE